MLELSLSRRIGCRGKKKRLGKAFWVKEATWTKNRSRKSSSPIRLGKDSTLVF